MGACASLLPAFTADEAAKLARETFRFKGYIAQTEHRGIKVHQLQSVLDFGSRYCRRWTEASRPGTEEKAPKRLNRSFNLYHLNAWLIKPATQAENCAFVELMTGEKQEPDWFCSHWWGESVRDFCECLVEHESIRAGDGTFTYWVCAYANRQWSLGQELTMDPRQTSFFKAMQLSIGVLLILDSAATPFSRIWCAFEEAIALTQSEGREKMLLLDIATTKNGYTFLLTDGLTQAEATSETGADEKAERESEFPLEVLTHGIQVKLEHAQASMEEDRMHILNCIAARPLDSTPLDSCEAYDLINVQLRSRFALSSWQRAIEKKMVEKLKLPEAVRSNGMLTKLSFDLSGLRNYKLLDSDLASIGDAFPKNLLTLSMNLFSCSSLTDKALQHLVQRLPGDLKEFHLDCMLCTKLSPESVEIVARCLPSSITSFTYDCRREKGPLFPKDWPSVFAKFVSTLPAELRELPVENDEGLITVGKRSDRYEQLQHLFALRQNRAIEKALREAGFL